MKTYNGKRRYCTIPTWVGLGKWYVKRFNDLCEAHDDAYANQTGKWKADMTMIKGMVDRGYWYMAIPTFVLFNTFGFVYYYTK
jgi:hypothetical protein